MARFSDILEGKGTSLIPQLHLQQVGLFLWRKGIELLPLFDDVNRSRKRFLDRLWHQHKVSLYFDDIWLKGALTGEVLLYMRPLNFSEGLKQGLKLKYQFLYYDANQFEPFYDDSGNLIRVDIISVVETPESEETQFIRLGRDVIQVIKDDEPSVEFVNPYGFIPAVVIQNKPTQLGRGIPEFENFQGQIEQHDWQMDQIHGNIEFFGGPIFYSSRSKSEMIDSGLVHSGRRSIAEADGFGYSRSVERIKARRIISGMEEGEQLGFATPTPIDSSSFRFIERYEAQLRFALGSLPDRYQVGDMLATEIDAKTKYAPVIATSYKRAESYITYGLVELYRLTMKMAYFDKLVFDVDDDRINWRYVGDVFPDTAQTQLTKSIVSRNLIRLGVNLHESIQHIFPDMKTDEIERLLEGGFAYELLNGVSQVASRFDADSNGDLIDLLKQVIIQEVENARDREYATLVKSKFSVEPVTN